MADSAVDERYDLKVGRHDLKGVTLVDALRALTAEYQQMRGNCSAEMQAHGERMGRGAESIGAAAVAMISEGLGRATMPPLEIWDPAFAALDCSRQLIRALSVEGARLALVEAQEAYLKAHAAVMAYDGKLESGGERAVTALKVTAAAGAVAAGVATGGAASAAGMGVTGTATVGAASAGAYGAAQEMAGQSSEVYFANTRKAIDWNAVLRRGATDAATGLVAGLVGGALTKQFSKMFGSYLGKAISDAELVEMGKALGLAGPLERAFFMTTGQKLIAEFLSTSLLVPVQSAITLVVNRISGGAPGPKNMEEFMEGVAFEVVQGGVFMLLVAFLTHKMPPPKPAKTGAVGEARTAAGATVAEAPKAARVDVAALHKSGAASQPSTSASASERSLSPKVASQSKPAVVERATAPSEQVNGVGKSKASEGTAKTGKSAEVGSSNAGVTSAKSPVASEPLTRDQINKLPGIHRLRQRLEKANLSLSELGLTEQGLQGMADKNPQTLATRLNRLVDIHELHAADVEPKGVPRSKKVDAPHAKMPAEKKWTRIEALGQTPGKRSKIGKQVISRMRSAGKLKGKSPNEWVFHESTKKWFPIDECDMGHSRDAVTWWNKEGMFHGAKSPIVRKWMTDPAIYELEPGDINSARGAALPDEYVAPHPDPITPEELAGQVKKRN